MLAEAMFREGRELMDQNKVSEACTKFAESYRLDHALGTLINLALCHEKDGKTATAWAEFTDAAAEAVAEKDDRETFARRHIASLEADLPRLQLSVAAANETLPTLEIKLDGHTISKAAWSTALPIDPGDHELTAAAEGKKSFSAKVAIPKGTGLTSSNIPALVDAPKVIVVQNTAPPPEPIAQGGTQRLLGYIVGGVGVAGLAVGLGFGASALSLKGDRDARCSGQGCDPEGLNKDKSARDAATISTISVIAGAALLAGGVVLVLTAPKVKKPVSVGVMGTGLVFGGAF